MNFTHTERKTLDYVNRQVIVPLDLRSTVDDLRRRGAIKRSRGRTPSLYVVESALAELNRKPEAVDPKRVNQHTGVLIDKDE